MSNIKVALVILTFYIKIRLIDRFCSWVGQAKKNSQDIACRIKTLTRSLQCLAQAKGVLEAIFMNPDGRSRTDESLKQPMNEMLTVEPIIC